MQALGRSHACVAIAVAMLTSASFSLTAQAPISRQRNDFLTPVGVDDFLRPVGITGEVHKPGTFPVVDAPTLAQLLEMAGGLTENAGSTAILIHFADNVPLTPPSRAALMGLIRPRSAVPPNITLTRIALTESRCAHAKTERKPECQEL
jgi:SLBB domain-containing protein